MSRVTFVALVIASCCLAARVTTATVISQDTFDSAGATTSDDVNDPSDMQWGVVHSTTISVVNDAGGLGSGNALDAQMAGTFPGVSALFPMVTLGIGDSVKLTADFRFTASPAARDNGLRFGLEQYGAISNSLIFFQGTGGTTGAEFRYWPDHQFAGSGSTILPSGGDPAISINDQLEHFLSMEIVRVPSGLSLTVDVDGSTFTASATGATAFYSFNRLEFGEGDFATDFRLDNVTITSIPEPAGAMLGGVLVAIATFARPRRAVQNAMKAMRAIRGTC